MIVSFAVVTLLGFCSPASSFAFLPRVSRTDDAVIIDFDGVGYAPSYQGKTLYGQITNPGFVPLPSFNPYYPAMYRQQEETPNGWSYSYEYPNPLTVGDLIKQTPAAAAPTCGAGPVMPARALTSERIAGGVSAKKNAWSFIVS
ncbi:hypothetical protein DAPPUDRAFT_105472 [Daphnia pulex]|uniref:Uncharacterized protein n=1 Tax=Daphnia pulex TaxID=6669 RepID=E9GQX7_DAPPU|nr:hypothetical protein DAPPUDRAFT_105472 [Daphnia pulex]|eukprot:EFX78192.1 hypothetical protein DAPPUDRAFT_105472 [Daphnia pulex]